MSVTMNEDICILDGYGLIYRAYFALISKPLTDRDGNNVSAILGFFRTLFSLYAGHDAERIVVALDPAGPTFRHQLYPEYKANRDPAPVDLHAQVPLIKDMLGFLGIPVICMDGFEADDIMGSVAAYCRKKGLICQVVSTDKDVMQLICDTVIMLRPEKGGNIQVVDEDVVQKERGVRPDQFIDYLALVGDSTDNIPGVAGIGPKSAAELLSEWGDLDRLYDNLDAAAKGARLKRLTAGRDNAYLSRDLVTIRKDLDVAEIIESASFRPVDFAAAVAFLRDRSMRSLVDELAALFPEYDLPEDKAVAGGDDGENQIQYTAILTSKQLASWKEKILQAGIVALDTETDSLDPMRASLVGLSMAVDSLEAAYLPVRRPDGECLNYAVIVEWLTDVFCRNPVKIIGQNFKYDIKVLRRAGVPIGSAWFDTMIAAWVLDVSSPIGMDALASRYLRVSTLKFKDVVPANGSFADVPLDLAMEYAAEDAAVTLQLYKHLAPLLEADGERLKVFREYEMPLLPILAEMEIEGIGLDVFELEAYASELKEGIYASEREIYSLCGRKFNIASPKQLQQILFEERGLTPSKKTKTGYSTDNSVLRDLAADDPLPGKVLFYRSLTKLKSTYVDVLPQMIHPEDGRIHTNYSQTGAATGRLASTNPNLQNIPVRDDNGRRIRAAFKSRPGCKFVSADYSQIELVVLAHISGDEALSNAFHSSIDIHAQTAVSLLGLDAADITSEHRRIAKTVNFGVMYGMSPFRLSNELRISRKEAQHFIEAYFTTYSGVKRFIDETIKATEKDGGVRTMAGRFRPLPGIKSPNHAEKSAAERAAVNSRIQGTAADIVKSAMIAVDRSLKEHHPNAKLLLQVHDELLIEAPDAEAPEVASRVKKVMEEASLLSVPLRVDVEIGMSWGDIH